MMLDEGLRSFLSTFWLPGEAAQIDRIMQAFASQLFEHAPGPLANEDAAYVLAFSVIMLNTDLHNASVPRKMSLQSWFKNNSKINDGGDLPGEYLETIYNSIKTNEIKMQKQHEFSGETGADASEEWAMLIKRTKTGSGASSFATSKAGSHDSDMFHMIWADSATALSVVFETTGDEKVLAKVVDGYNSMVHTAEFHELLEVPNAIINSLFKMLHKFMQIQLTKTPNEPLVAFGRSSKAQLAASTLFSIAHAHGSCLRDGWRSFVDWILRLQSLKMLPSLLSHHKSILDLSALPRPVIKWEPAAPPEESTEGSSDSGIWGFLWGGEKAPNPDEIGEMQQARERALGKLESCKVAELFSTSNRLENTSVAHLLQTLMAVCRERQDHQDEQSAVVCLDLLTWVVTQNQSRLELCWPPVATFLEEIIRASSDRRLTPSMERAVLAVLQVLVELLADSPPAMARMLSLLRSIAPPVLSELAECISAGLLQLLQLRASKMSTPVWQECWGLLLQLVAEFALHPRASDSAWDCLSLVVNDGISCVSRENYSSCLHAAAAFASDLNQQSQARSLAALDRILMLYRHFPAMVLAHQQAGSEERWEEAFAVLWLSLIHI
eukprot:TRINITY_DN3003_c0_g2_i2.p1 TRINITY_DN3003_c0_g2~~TRINITY_DN3003_c0_g2_i2.p1  ORF type:complete len:610 (-),score=173.59 TRINITY_DN3003_c0_g2_i2:126-1955(-)